MRSNQRESGPSASPPDVASRPGLEADELQAEQASDLPDREAMSILDVGAVEIGLPPPAYLDDVVEQVDPDLSQPVDGLPVEHYPIDRLPIDLPIDRLPVEPVPIDQLPVQPLPAETAPIGVPDPISVPEKPGTVA
jgi:hypothetical protein